MCTHIPYLLHSQFGTLVLVIIKPLHNIAQHARQGSRTSWTAALPSDDPRALPGKDSSGHRVLRSACGGSPRQLQCKSPNCTCKDRGRSRSLCASTSSSILRTSGQHGVAIRSGYKWLRIGALILGNSQHAQAQQKNTLQVPQLHRDDQNAQTEFLPMPLLATSKTAPLLDVGTRHCKDTLCLGPSISLCSLAASKYGANV